MAIRVRIRVRAWVRVRVRGRGRLIFINTVRGRGSIGAWMGSGVGLGFHLEHTTRRQSVDEKKDARLAKKKAVNTFVADGETPNPNPLISAPYFHSTATNPQTLILTLIKPHQRSPS